MSNPQLPREILDYTVDHLHDNPGALKKCCLVSKSWVPRTRKHIFARVNFNHAHELAEWKKTFPDPTNSPAYHTRSLFVGCPRSVTAEDAEEGGWIRAFSRVVRFEVDTRRYYHSEISLVPFHNFSPALKSLRVISSIPRSRIFNLVCSLPLLEDLSIREFRVGGSDSDGTDFQPLTSPLFTGTFRLYSGGGTGPIVRQLLDLPSGFRFRKLVLTWRNQEDIRWITTLMARCSDTLECLDIRQALYCTFPWLLHLDQYLTRTFICTNRQAAGLYRLIQGDEGQKHDIPVRRTEPRMDCYGAPNNYIQTSKSPADHNPCSSSPLSFHSRI